MSSETSTDVFHPWQLFTLAGLIGATIVVLVSRGQAAAGIIFLSLTVFASAVVGIAAWRTLAPFTGSDERTGPPVAHGRTRAALEREKTLVLRALKALEFDRAMGKLSEDDFADMSGRLRSRAGGLIRQLDSGTGYRKEIEEEIARRLGAGSGSGELDLGDVRPEARVARPVTRACPGCDRDNDLDARFCKHCGGKLGTTA